MDKTPVMQCKFQLIDIILFDSQMNSGGGGARKQCHSFRTMIIIKSTVTQTSRAQNLFKTIENPP